MANVVETLVASAAIKCAAEKYYNFFKSNISDLVKIFPAAYTGVEIIEGEQGVVGGVTLWHYILGGVPLTMKVKTEAVDDGGKSISLAAIEGDVLLLYKSFKGTLTVNEGLAKWTLEFEKATPITPPPQLYVPLLISVCTLVDAYLLIN